MSRCTITDHNNTIDEDIELIDVCNYTRDTRDMILTEKDVRDIINEKELQSQQKHLEDAFRLLRSKSMLKFRKLVSVEKAIINTKYDNTYLIHEACKMGDPDFVSFLLFLGAQCNLIDGNGFSAQHYAVQSRSTLIVDLLSLFGNTMNIKDKNGYTPFYYALMNNDNEMIRTLMIYNSDRKSFVENELKSRETNQSNRSSLSDILFELNKYLDDI